MKVDLRNTQLYYSMVYDCSPQYKVNAWG